MKVRKTKKKLKKLGYQNNKIVLHTFNRQTNLNLKNYIIHFYRKLGILTKKEIYKIKCSKEPNTTVFDSIEDSINYIKDGIIPDISIYKSIGIELIK